MTRYSSGFLERLTASFDGGRDPARAAEMTAKVRVFAYCRRRDADTEFFIRKAIGWALRQDAKTHPPSRASYATTTRSCQGCRSARP